METAVTELGQVLHRFSKALKKSHTSTALTHGEALVLIITGKHSANAPLTPSALGDVLGMSRPSVTPILNALEKKGCIVRSLNTADRRKLEIRLTDKGRQLAEDELERFNSALNKLTQGLGEKKSVQLTVLLRQATDILEQKQ